MTQETTPADMEREETLAAVPFTCRLTAAYRWIEYTRALSPILSDDLAIHLAGAKALTMAEDEWSKLQADQGPDKHFRVPARSRIIDDTVLEHVAALSATAAPPATPSATAGAVQVVCLGAGMDTRPWRLDLGQHVRYFEVDHEDVVRLKQQLLASCGAQLSPPSPSPSPSSTTLPPAHKYPLRCGSWAACGGDLTDANLSALLAAQGFSTALPTVWVAEGLIYYMPLADATPVLATIADLSPPGSLLLATCIDAELWQSHKSAQHAFANLWHFCVDQLIVEGGVPGTAWVVSTPARATWALAKERYSKETYRPLVYDGHEEFFVARKL